MLGTIKDLGGVSCKDDSTQGSMKTSSGPGRKPALTYWSWHKVHGTKCLVAENVCTGTIHQECAELLAGDGTYDIRVVHTSPDDVGYGAIKRQRGWFHG